MTDIKSATQEDSSTIVVVAGAFNWSPSGEPETLGAYNSTSITVGAAIEAADSEPYGAPSKPLNAGAVKALNSVLHSRVPNTAILRDESGEL